MISYIRGKMLDWTEDGTVIIDVNGIGYEVSVPGRTLGAITSKTGDIELYTYLQVKEDGISLFGFVTKEEMSLFKKIITVSGVGPKGALNILSLMTREQFILAVIGEDPDAIAKAPGIGKKTAAKIVLELKDKYTLEDTFSGAADHTEILSKVTSNSKKDDSANAIKNDAVAALCALGYSSSEALKAVRAVKITEDMTVDEVLSQSLRNL